MSREALRPVIRITAVLMLVAVAMAVYLSGRITSRISRLAHQMETVESERQDWIPEKEPGQDEIGQLFESFYYMQRRIDDLLQQEYESGKAVKQAELRALRAQINPHFLYNTLDLINWEAMDCGSQKIMEISRAMAKFYKLSLNRGKEFSSIREEIEHVSYYIQIQNLRYDNRLKLELEIPEELYDLRVLHIVLQPLVENSLLHGMAGRSEEEELHLVIVAQRHDSDLFITVDDHGIGMEQKQMDEILQEKASADSGYGVQNIHARIQLVYGSDYGLTYSTSDRGGVRVTLHFPCQNMKGEPV